MNHKRHEVLSKLTATVVVFLSNTSWMHLTAHFGACGFVIRVPCTSTWHCSVWSMISTSNETTVIAVVIVAIMMNLIDHSMLKRHSNERRADQWEALCSECHYWRQDSSGLTVQRWTRYFWRIGKVHKFGLKQQQQQQENIGITCQLSLHCNDTINWQLDNVSTLAVEVFWMPKDHSEVLTSCNLVLDFPELIDLWQGWTNNLPIFAQSKQANYTTSKRSSWT